MVELFNRNLQKAEPGYYYRVHEFVTTFGADEGKNEGFDHDKEFKGNDLLKCKADAEKYYFERFNGLEKAGKYFLPFATPRDFIMGKNAASSITLYFVEYYDEERQYHFALRGENEDDMKEGRELENYVLKEKGFL